MIVRRRLRAAGVLKKQALQGVAGLGFESGQLPRQRAVQLVHAREAGLREAHAVLERQGTLLAAVERHRVVRVVQLTDSIVTLVSSRRRRQIPTAPAPAPASALWAPCR